MAYGYKQWLEHEGKDAEGKARDPRIGALEKVLEIVDALGYPMAGWGMIDPDELGMRIRKIIDADAGGGNEAWDGALKWVLDYVAEHPFLRYSGKIDPKDLVSEIKKTIKEAQAA